MNKTTIYIIAASSVVLLIVIAAIVFYYFGKDKVTTTKLPDATDWGKSLTEAESKEIARIAAALHDDIDGVNFWNRDMTPYKDFLSAESRIFIGVCNHYAESYGESITTAINGENYGWTNTFNYQEIIPPLLQRLATNGIK